MKIAIVGAGFSGLACAYYLRRHNHVVTLFDARGVGGGASGIAAGLMHPYGGVKAELNWQAREGYDEAKILFSVAEEVLGEKVAYQTGMFRPALTDTQGKWFLKAGALYPDTEWWEDSPYGRGLFIRSAFTIDSKKYLQGLFKAAQCSLEIAAISHIEELKEFDVVILATGAAHIKGIRPVKGQLLVVSAESSLPYALNSSGYVAQIEPTTCILGATFESSWEQEGPDPDVCVGPIREKIAKMSPEIAKLPLLEVRAGFRAMSKNKRPFFQHIENNVWYLGGMGSKGLLYHALLAKQLSRHCFIP